MLLLWSLKSMFFSMVVPNIMIADVYQLLYQHCSRGSTRSNLFNPHKTCEVDAIGIPVLRMRISKDGGGQ